MSIPTWLQILLGLFQIFEPQFAWIVPVIEDAYKIWQLLPFLHKAGALFELKAAVAAAKINRDVTPVTAFTERWKAHVAQLPSKITSPYSFPDFFSTPISRATPCG